MIRRLLVIASLVGVAAALAGYLFLRSQYPPVEGWNVHTVPDPAFDALDPWIRSAFLDTARPETERYADLFRYLVAGFVAYRTEGGARAHYPGFASVHGRAVDGLEGFSRIAPVIGAWLAGGRVRTVHVASFGDVDLVALLRSGIVEGTDPASAEYWGDIGLLDQRVLEAADIALAVWLTRDSVWKSLDPVAKSKLVGWLAQADGKADTSRFVNWLLAPMLVNRVLEALGEPVSQAGFRSDWTAIRASYAGDGWFRDSADGEFDYYNAWAFHYSLYWLTQIDGTLDERFVRDARTAFSGFYRHLLTPRGFPILGRSLCYRTAAPVPLIVASVTDPDVIPPGEARHALDVTWRYFVGHGALANGVLTQGYCGADVRLVDQYSGPASCLWGARSLVAAFAQPDQSPLWTAEEVPLPVEQGDFSLDSDTLGWHVTGNRNDASVVIHRLGKSKDPQLQPYSMKYQLASLLLQRPFRPSNRPAKYERATYSSGEPFCGCESATQ